MSGRVGLIVGVVAVIAATLSGCSEPRKLLAYDKNAPDPRNVARAPLALPPDFGLRPQSAGSARLVEADVRDGGTSGRRGLTRIDTKGRSLGEIAFLRSAGAERSIPDIRRVLDREMTALAQEEKAFTERLVLGGADPAPEPPAGEKQAGETETTSAASPTDSGSPTIRRRDGTTLMGLF
ncbi:MAG: DUF3035 domain-containing protein [Alphaproteobacteria bacterium]